MTNKHSYDEILIKYLANDVSNEDKAFVENWLNADAGNRLYFEELKKAWNLTGVWNTFEKVNADDKWDHFKQTVIETAQPRKKAVRRWLMPAAVAASVLLVISLSWTYFFREKQSTITTYKPDPNIIIAHHEINTTGKDKTIQLPDGSLMVLADSSEANWNEPFTQQRNIVLTGKAYFKVARDTARPFTVTSGGIATTALGTQFLVTAYAGTNKIAVRLYEGKVVVWGTNIRKNVYLVPGQEFVYDGSTLVRWFKQQPTATPQPITHEDIIRDNPYIPYLEDSSWYMFNNQPLERVLKELSALHQVKIIYNIEDVRHIDFTGKYNKSESVEAILSRIGIINNLRITKKDSAFIISKQ